jgi:hypothetical protein
MRLPRFGPRPTKQKLTGRAEDQAAADQAAAEPTEQEAEPDPEGNVSLTGGIAQTHQPGVLQSMPGRPALHR